MGWHRRRLKGESHRVVVITTAVRALTQHGTSLRRWSPYAQAKCAMISSLDDYCHKILFADLLEQPPMDGTFREIKVRVKDRECSIFYRRGYLAIDSDPSKSSGPTP
jgi:hypothetical protein